MDKKSFSTLTYIKQKLPYLHTKILGNYMYVIELKAMATLKKRLTGLPIVHSRYGAAITGLEAVKIETVSTDTDSPLQKEEKKVIDEVIEKWQNIPFNIKNNSGGMITYICYTLPFRETPFDTEINFEKYTGEPDLETILIKEQKYKKIKKNAEGPGDLIKKLMSKEGLSYLEKYLERQDRSGESSGSHRLARELYSTAQKTLGEYPAIFSREKNSHMLISLEEIRKSVAFLNRKKGGIDVVQGKVKRLASFLLLFGMNTPFKVFDENIPEPQILIIMARFITAYAMELKIKQSLFLEILQNIVEAVPAGSPCHLPN